MDQVPAADQAGECANVLHFEAYLVIYSCLCMTDTCKWGSQLYNFIFAKLSSASPSSVLWKLGLDAISYGSKRQVFSCCALESVYQSSDKILRWTVSLILVVFCLCPAIFHILPSSIPFPVFLLLHEHDLIWSYSEQNVVLPLPVISMPVMVLDGMSGSSLNRGG